MTPTDQTTDQTDQTTDQTDQGEQTGRVPPLPPLPPPTPPAPPGPPRDWLRAPVARDPDRGKVGGVVAGLARAYGFDLKTTRIAVLVSTIVVPVLIAVYGAAWLLLPERPDRAMPLAEVVRDRRRMPLLIALGIVVVAGGIGSFGSWFLFGGVPWGLGLIAIGVVLWAAPNLMTDRGRAAGSGAASTAYGPPVPPPAPWTGTADATGGRGAPLPADAPVTGAWRDASDGARDGLGGGRGAPVGASTLPPPVQRPARRRYPVDAVGWSAAMTFVLIAAGGDALDWWDLPILTGVFVVVAILWGSHLLSGIVNRRWSVIPGLLVLGAIGTGFLVTQPDLDGGVGKERVRPLTLADATRPQELGVGELTLDLTGVADASTVEAFAVQAEVGVGRLHVLVPDGTVLELRSRVGAGHVVVDGDEIVAGLDHDDDRRDEPDAPGAAGADLPTIVLDLEIGLGEISVERVAP